MHSRCLYFAHELDYGFFFFSRVLRGIDVFTNTALRGKCLKIKFAFKVTSHRAGEEGKIKAEHVELVVSFRVYTTVSNELM